MELENFGPDVRDSKNNNMQNFFGTVDLTEKLLPVIS